MRKIFMKKAVMTVFGLMCAGMLAAQWTHQANLQVTTGGVAGFEAKTNKDGVTFVAFWKFVKEDPARLGDRFADELDVAYYLQIIDRDGAKLFPDTGKLISNEPSRSFTAGIAHTLFIDSDGNALYTVKDERNASFDQQGFFVYKISPTGEMLWDEPLDLGRGYAPGQAYNFSEVIQLSDGSYIFAYDIEAGDRIMYIVIERASKVGVLSWDAPLLLTDPVENFAFPYLTADGSRFILVYSKGGSLNSGKLYAQKYARSDKASIWETPATIYTGGFTSGQTPMTVVDFIPDGQGGCFVAWYDDHNNTRYEKAYVSHILPTGEQGFVTSGEGLQVSFSSYMRAFRPAMGYDPAGENLYVAFEEHDSDQNYRTLVLQKVSKEGELLWSEAEGEDSPVRGKLLDEAESHYYSIQPAGTGKILVFYQHFNENIAVLFDVSGDLPVEERRLVFAQGGSKGGFVSSPLQENEYFFTFWMSGSAVYAQKLPADLQIVDETGLPSVDNGNGNEWKVSLANHTLRVLNPAREYIDRIQLYAPDGSLLQELSVRSADNVLIPVSIKQKIVLVKIIGKNTTTFRTMNDER
jgi:hypothetical protein